MHEFCPRCSNLLYEQTAAASVTLRCRNCAFEREATEARLLCTTDYTDEGAFDANQLALLAKHLPDDPTLPRVSTIACPSPACSKTAGAHETIVYEYDSKNLRFLYVCVKCRHAWRHGS